MKKYIQLTAGRGPVECARAVTLVARELLKDFPDAELVENEPHNTEPDCYMSMLFLAEVDPAKEQEWSGTVLWRAASDRYRPPEFPSSAAADARSRRTKKRHAACSF